MEQKDVCLMIIASLHFPILVHIRSEQDRYSLTFSPAPLLSAHEYVELPVYLFVHMPAWNGVILSHLDFIIADAH